MFRRIMVPLDGSVTSERALPVAARLARASGGTLILVRVANQPLTYSPYIVAAVDVSPPDLHEAGTVAQSYLDDIRKRAVVAGISVETYIEFGPVAAAIIAAVKEHQADLLVLSSHGVAGPSSWVLGGVPRKLARHAPVPVLWLREEAETLSAGQSGAGHPIEVLVPLDGSPLAESALQPADELLTALCGSSPAVLNLLRVVELPHQDLRGEQVELREELDAIALDVAVRDAETYLERVAHRLRALPTFDRAVSITTSVLFDDDIAQGIVEAAHGRRDSQSPQERPVVAAIVLATHGRGGLDRWVMGSITEHLSKVTNLPLLIVPPQRTAANSRAAIRETHRPYTAP